MSATGREGRASQWAVFLQYAEHRDVLLTDGAWIRSDAPTARPDLLLKPRLFPTRKAAEEFTHGRFGLRRHVVVSRWAP
jgi:hypothetical protein